MAVVRFRPSLSIQEASAFLRATLSNKDQDLVSTFERRFSEEMIDGRPAILAPSGRVALYWILRGLHMAPGDEVVTQSFNFAAVPAAIQAAGATPRFVDLQPDGFHLDPDQLRAVLGPRTRAVILTHLFGNPGDLDRVGEMCRARGVALVEDCGQGVGASWHGQPVGTFGVAALYTFGATKNFTLLGGGAATTSDSTLARRMEELAARHPAMGLGKCLKLAAVASGITLLTSPLIFNLAVLPGIRLCGLAGVDPVHTIMDEPEGPMTSPEASALPSELMAAVGLQQLQRHQDLNAARVRNGWHLHQALSPLTGLTVPACNEGNVFMSFPIFHPRRRALAEALRKRGVDTDLGFMSNCASLEMFAPRRGDFPHSQRAADEIVHLPVHPGLSGKDLERIVVGVRGALKDVA